MWDIYAEHANTLASAEQAGACNCMLLRNKVFQFANVHDAFAVWAFCMAKYPLANVRMTNEELEPCQA